mgnify:CR=1 FL=1
MLADFYIPWLSNDMKIAVQKNHLRGQILYISLGPVKKRRQKFWLKIYFLFYIYNVSIKPASNKEPLKIVWFLIATPFT